MASMNWGQVSYTVGSTVYAIDGVQSIEFSRQGHVKQHRGGDALFPRLVTFGQFARSATIASADIAALAQLPQNSVGVLSGVFLDPLNGLGAGALVIVLENAVLVSQPYGGAQNAFGVAHATFVAYSTDGLVDPYSISLTT